MKKILFPVFFAIFCGGAAFAHFQLVYTPASILEEADNVRFILAFTHPAEAGHTMDAGKNEAGEIKGFKTVYSVHKGAKTDLLPALEKTEFSSPENSASAYSLTLNKENGFRGAGDWVLVAVPHPYYEQAEDVYIQQVTKVIINKGEMSTDWKERCAEGYPEIMPLVKPYDVVTGGIFRGVVVDSKGRPVPNAEIEFEYINYDIDMEANAFTGEAKLGKSAAGVLLADAMGVFSFIPQKAGYWGFAALGAGNEKEFLGKELSQDAVLWIEARDDPAAFRSIAAADDESGVLIPDNTVSEKNVSVRKGVSPAALIIVILLFAVLFAWPPVFKKMTEKKAAENA